jgi:hypothetical protein
MCLPCDVISVQGLHAASKLSRRCVAAADSGYTLHAEIRAAWLLPGIPLLYTASQAKLCQLAFLRRASSECGGNGALMHNAVLVLMSKFLGTMRAIDTAATTSSSSSSSSSVCGQQGSSVGLPGRPMQPCMPQQDPAVLLARQQQAVLAQLQACAEQPLQAARQLIRQQVRGAST